jgi:hypothetical protein
LRENSPRTAPNSQSAEARTYSASVADGQWHHFGAEPAPTVQASSAKTGSGTKDKAPTLTYRAKVSNAL